MSYYRLLQMDKEPFSTSPDPDFFFLSREHKAALCRLQVSIMLRRGLSVLLGDVGTGKTTLSRRLAQALAEDPRVDFHMILNPFFRRETEFLSRIARLLQAPLPAQVSGLDMIEAIERVLFTRGVEEGRIVVLLMDEAQMLPKFVLEALRILLNYETNEYKILQVVLVGQMELLPRISQVSNFWDRIALKYVINPLDEAEVEQAIEFRLRQAGYRGTEPLFTRGAIRLIARHTQGYPRRVTMLCHNALEALVMYDKRVADESLIRRLIEREIRPAGVPA